MQVSAEPPSSERDTVRRKTEKPGDKMEKKEDRASILKAPITIRKSLTTSIRTIIKHSKNGL